MLPVPLRDDGHTGLVRRVPSYGSIDGSFGLGWLAVDYGEIDLADTAFGKIRSQREPSSFGSRYGDEPRSILVQSMDNAGPLAVHAGFRRRNVRIAVQQIIDQRRIILSRCGMRCDASGLVHDHHMTILENDIEIALHWLGRIIFLLGLGRADDQCLMTSQLVFAFGHGLSVDEGKSFLDPLLYTAP